MKLGQCVVALAVALGISSQAFADPVGASLVVAGGVSLGSYQAGFLYYYSEYLKAQNIKVVAVTGASAGAINATIAAIESCRTPQPDPTESPYWKVWMPVGLDELLPEDGRSVTRMGLLQREPLEKAATFLQEYIERKNDDAERQHWASRTCQVPIGIVATRLAPEPVTGPIPAKRATERFGVVFDKDVEGRLAHITDCSFDANTSLARTGATQCNNEALIRHPGSNNQPLGKPTFGDLRDLLFASSSFPLAFEPMPVVSHDRVGGSTTTELYVDGGVFDNIPVAFAHTLLAGNTSELVVVDSDNTPWKPSERRSAAYSSIVDAATAFARGFVGAARTRELLTLNASVSYPERRAMLTSDYLFAFSGFLDQHFREFDFYLGMLDARNFVRRAGTDQARVDTFEQARIRSRAFECFKKLETISMGFQQVPDWDKSVSQCIDTKKARGAEHLVDGEDKKILDLVSLFGASVDTQQFAISASEPSQFEVFQHFLGVLQTRGFKFSLHGDTFPAEDLIYQLRRVSGKALGQLADKQPEYGTTMRLLSDVALDMALFHILPDFYWSLGVHLNRGFDADISWGYGETKQSRLGLGFRLRRFSLLERPVAASPSLNAIYSLSVEATRSFSVDFGAELGLGYRFGTGAPDEHGIVRPALRSGIRQVAALSAACVWYDSLYLRFDARLYSRMSRHWPSDYSQLELGAGIGWRFH